MSGRMQGGYRADAWGPLLPAASGWASEFSSTGCLVFASQVLLKPRVFTLRIMVKILLVPSCLCRHSLNHQDCVLDLGTSLRILGRHSLEPKQNLQSRKTLLFLNKFQSWCHSPAFCISLSCLPTLGGCPLGTCQMP